MNWSALKATRGDILPAEMEAGLLKKLWNRRMPPSSGKSPTSRQAVFWTRCLDSGMLTGQS
jgi:hypothetical protein